MAIVFRRAKKYLEKNDAAIKGLVFGSAGSGKSWFAAQSPNPVVILTEKNGLTSVAHSNPDAIVIEVTSADELWEVLIMAKGGSLNLNDEDGKEVKIEFDTLVIDSLTEAQRLLKDYILQTAKRDEFILKDWNTLTNHMQRLVRLIRDLPCHVICTALMEESYEDSTGKRFVRPQFEGKKTTQQISQYFNFVGYLYKKDGGASVTSDLTPRFLMLDGPNNYMCKPAHPVVGVIENPEVSKILADIQGTNGKTTSKVAENESPEQTKPKTRRRRRQVK